MTDRQDGPRYHSGGLGEERLLREDLRRFHTCVSDEDALDPMRMTRWQAISSPRLRQGCGVDLAMEAAWALLARWEGTTDSDEAPDGGVSRALLRGLLATVPPLTTWLRYVERVPAGEGMEGFRLHRRETILRWFPHVHPDPSLLAEYVRGDPALPALVRAGIAAHLRGPYSCFSCRSAVRRLSSASQRAEASQRLIAATPADESHEHEALIRVRDTEYRLRVRFLVDGGFLRVFASYDGDRTLPRTEMKLAVVFGNGQVREASIVYPDHGLIGANLGPLRGLRVDEIVSFSLEA